MKIPSQKEVWNSIAPEWYEFKNHQDPRVIEFVKRSKDNLLDLGSGTGRNFHSGMKTTIYALDFSSEMLKYADDNAKKLGIKIKLIQHDLNKKLPFQNDFFERIICIATLHCIKGKTNRQKILKEIYRVLKPNSKLLIKVWNRKSKRFGGKKEKIIRWQDKGERYYYFYTREELEDEVKKAGFKIISIESQRNNFESQEIVILAKK